MRPSTVSVPCVWLLCAAMAGCGGPADNLEYEQNLAACAGAHEGSFTGDLSGGVQATLQLDGTLIVTFHTTAGDVDADGYVDVNGVVTGERNGIEVEGAYDFDACEASGTWSNALLDADGSWSIARP